MEYGIIAPPGRNFVKKLAEQIENPDSDLPSIVMELSRVHLDQLSVITDKVVAIERRLKEEPKSDPETIRLQTAPGIGPVSAMAIKAFSPPLESFKRGRDYAAWLGLVPVQKSARRQANIRQDIEDGATRYASIVDHWRHVPGQIGDQEWPAERLMAGADVGAQAAHVGGDCARQQNSANHLGNDDEA